LPVEPKEAVMTLSVRSALVAGVLSLPVAVLAQASASHSQGTDGAVIVQPKELKWGPSPAALPPGSKAVVLEGDPSKAGAFILRVKMPAHYRIAPHHHPADERVTLLSGAVKIGMGEQFDEAKMSALPAGGYFSMPKGHRHYFEATKESVIQLNGMGPWDIIYVNPADDPRKQPGQPKKAPGSAP
jgi:quercetin dioxygenase-like cupin family protein